MKNSQKINQRKASRARKPLQKFGYSVLGQMRALVFGPIAPNQKSANYFGYNVSKFGNSALGQMRALFSNNRLLLSRAEYTSYITSNIRIQAFSPDITSEFWIILELIIGGYVLRNLISQKMKNDSFEQFHSAEKCKRGTLYDFLNIYYVAKYFKN